MTPTRVIVLPLAMALAACHGGRLSGTVTAAAACGDASEEDCAAVQRDIPGTAGAAPRNEAGSGGLQSPSGSAGAPVQAAGSNGGRPNGAAGAPSRGSAGAVAAETAGAGGDMDSGIAVTGGAGDTGAQAGAGGGAEDAGAIDPDPDARVPVPRSLYVAPRVVYVGEPRAVRIFGSELDAANGAAVFVDGEQVGTLTAVSAREGRVTLPGLAYGEHFLSVGSALAPERARLFTAEHVLYPDDEVAIPGVAVGLVYDPERRAFFGVFSTEPGLGAGVLVRVQFDGTGWHVEEIDVPSPSDVAMTADGRELLVSHEGCMLVRVDPDTLAAGNFEPPGGDCQTGQLVRAMADGQLLYGSYEGLWDYVTGERTSAPPYSSWPVSILSQHQTQLIWAEGDSGTGTHPVYSYAVGSGTFDEVGTFGGEWFQRNVLALSGDGDRFLHLDDVYDRDYRYLGRLATDSLTPEPLALSGDGAVAIALDANGLRAFDVTGLAGPFPAVGATVPFPAEQFGRLDRLVTDDTGQTAFAFATTNRFPLAPDPGESHLVVRHMLDAPIVPVQSGDGALFVAPRTLFAGEERSVRLFGTNAGIRNGQQVWIDGQAVATLTSSHAREGRVTLPPLAAGAHSLRIGDATAAVPTGPQARVVAVPRVVYDDAAVPLPDMVDTAIFDLERAAFYVVFAYATGARIRFDGAAWRVDAIDLPSVQSLALSADGTELLAMTGGRVLAHLDPDSLAVVGTDDLPMTLVPGNEYDTVLALADGRVFYGRSGALLSLFQYPSFTAVETPYLYGAEIFMSQDQTRMLWAEWYSISGPHPIYAYEAADTIFELLRSGGENSEYFQGSLALSANGRKLVHYGSVYDAGFNHLGDLALGGVLPWSVALSGDGNVAAAFDGSLRAFDVSGTVGPFTQHGEAIPFPSDSLGLLRQLVVDDAGRTAFAFTSTHFVVRPLPEP